MNRTLLATAIALAFSAPAALWANPNNTNTGSTGDAGGNITQEATAISKQKSNSGAQANEGSIAESTKTLQDVGNDKSQRTTDVTKTTNKTKTTNVTKNKTKNLTNNANGNGDFRNNTLNNVYKGLRGSFNVVALSKLSGTVSENTIDGIGNVIHNGGVNKASGGDGANAGKGGKGIGGDGGTGNANGTGAYGGEATSGNGAVGATGGDASNGDASNGSASNGSAKAGKGGRGGDAKPAVLATPV
jgi:hypothetical protein